MDETNQQETAPVTTEAVTEQTTQTEQVTTPEAAAAPAEPVKAEANPWDGIGESFLSQFTDPDEKSKVQAWMGRYATPTDAIRAAWVNNVKFQKGEVVPALPKNATPEQIKAYQEAMGVPETPEGYFAGALPDGLVIGDEDKPIFDELAKHMHSKGVSTKVMHEVASWYYDWSKTLVEKQEEQMAVMDAAFAKESQSALKKEWGPEYQLNMNHINSFVSRFNDFAGEDVVGQLTQARMPDGRLLFDSPAVAKAFSALARESNPIPSTVGGGVVSVQSLQSRLEELHKIRDTNWDKYFADGLNIEAGKIMETIQKRGG